MLLRGNTKLVVEGVMPDLSIVTNTIEGDEQIITRQEGCSGQLGQVMIYDCTGSSEVSLVWSTCVLYVWEATEVKCYQMDITYTYKWVICSD